MYKWFTSSLVALALTSATPASAASLLLNGDFEAGSFAGWTVTDLAGGTGSWFIDAPGSATPVSGLATLGGAGNGLFYAVTDQGGPGTHALTQSFTVLPGSTVSLSFDMFVNDQSGVGPIINPAGLTHLAGPNQHARVDILTAAASPFDTGAGVLATFYLGVDAGANPHAFTSYLFDITGIVGAGGTFQLRFAEVDNQFFFNMGVDNVSISDTAVPEPATLLMLGAGLAGLVWRRRSRRG